MSEINDMLESILSSPGDMEKIMSMAKELSGSLGIGEAPRPDKDKKGAEKNTSQIGDIDPKLIGLMSRVMGEYSAHKDDKKDLIESLKPYLKEERRNDLDRAAKIAGIARVARIAFSQFGGDIHI